MTDFDNITDNTSAEVSGQADMADADGAISPDAVVAPDADAGDTGGDGMAKLAIIAGLASILAIGVVLFLAMRGTICADALTGPVVKNTYVRFGRYIQDEKEPEPIVCIVQRMV